jgi:hypothetical protein
MRTVGLLIKAVKETSKQKTVAERGGKKNVKN